MPFHASVVAVVDLSSPDDDVQSPSQFVQRAEKLEGVELALRTAGRYDAVVWIHPDHDEHGSAEEALASAMETGLEVQGIDGVKDSSLLVWRPDEEDHEGR